MSKQMDTVEASETKPTTYGKKYRSNEEKSQDDDNSLTYGELRRFPKLTTIDPTKSGEESITYDKVEYFTAQRQNLKDPKYIETTQQQPDLQITPEKTSQNTFKSKNRRLSSSKSPQNKLSQETIEMIKKASQFKVPLLAPDSKNISKILSKPSLRDRFSNIQTISTMRELLLHQKYKVLIQKFEQIDQMIFFMKQRKVTPFWNQIQQNLYEASKVNITLSVIQCIISVWPVSYVLSWMINEKLIRIDKFDVVVQIQNGVSSEKRVEEFKNRLLIYVQTHGEHLEEADLPVRPDKQQAETIKDYIKNAESVNPVPIPKSQRAYEILKRIADINKAQQPKTIDLGRFKDLSNSGIENTQFSQALLNKVREKELRLKQENREIEGQPLSKENLLLIATMIFNYYLSRQVSNMFLANVVAYVKDNNKRVLLSNDQVLDNITQLLSMIPNWIKLIENTQGSIIRIDKSIQLPLVLKEIDNYTQLTNQIQP